MAATNFSVPRGHPFASMGDSPRSASGSDLGCFQILPLQWVSRVCEIFLCVLFKSRESVFYSPSSLLCTSILAFKADVLGACLHSAGPPGCRVWCEVGPLTLWAEPLQLWLSSDLWIAYPRLCVLTLCVCHCSYQSFCGSFFISLVMENFFASLQIIDSFSVNS